MKLSAIRVSDFFFFFFFSIRSELIYAGPCTGDLGGTGGGGDIVKN